jgi:hypothetical protein
VLRLTRVVRQIMDTAQIYKDWGIPFVIIGSGKLIAREYAVQLLEKIFQNGYYFLGYDAFTLFPNGTRQPHIEFSASYSKNRQLTLAEAIESIKEDSKEVSHYEFVFVLRD